MVLELAPDFKDFLKLLNEKQVKYLLIGGRSYFWARGVEKIPEKREPVISLAPFFVLIKHMTCP